MVVQLLLNHEMTTNATVLIAAICLVSLALSAASLVSFQRSATTTGRLATGGAAMLLGVLGLCLLALLIL